MFRIFRSLAVLAAVWSPFHFFSQRAEAILNYNIYESGDNLVVETTGNLNLPDPVDPFDSSGCSVGALKINIFTPPVSVICTGSAGSVLRYLISGPSTFAAGTAVLVPATTVSGLSTVMSVGGGESEFDISPTYTPGTPIISNAIFSGKTLADLGLTPTSGLLGTWTLVGSGDTINVNVVPGPLPVLGAGVAFGFSRRLRRRIRQSQFVADS
jgi:hypothetical protein